MKCSNENGQNGSLMKIRWNGKTMRKKGKSNLLFEMNGEKEPLEKHQNKRESSGLCEAYKSNSEKYEPFASNHIR